MNIKISILIILISSFLISGCSTKINNQNTITSASLEKTLRSKNNQNKHLYVFYDEWKDVKYKFGGNSKNGIDCSAFVQKAYKKSFNIQLPRTTKYQSNVGKTIKKSDLVFGDLVFFKTGYKTRHVGIYINNGKFMHASGKKGVTISMLNNIYYKQHYWKSKRILN